MRMSPLLYVKKGNLGLHASCFHMPYGSDSYVFKSGLSPSNGNVGRSTHFKGSSKVSRHIAFEDHIFHVKSIDSIRLTRGLQHDGMPGCFGSDI